MHGGSVVSKTRRVAECKCRFLGSGFCGQLHAMRLALILHESRCRRWPPPSLAIPRPGAARRAAAGAHCPRPARAEVLRGSRTCAAAPCGTSSAAAEQGPSHTSTAQCRGAAGAAPGWIDGLRLCLGGWTRHRRHKRSTQAAMPAEECMLRHSGAWLQPRRLSRSAPSALVDGAAAAALAEILLQVLRRRKCMHAQCTVHGPNVPPCPCGNVLQPVHPKIERPLGEMAGARLVLWFHCQQLLQAYHDPCAGTQCSPLDVHRTGATRELPCHFAGRKSRWHNDTGLYGCCSLFRPRPQCAHSAGVGLCAAVPAGPTLISCSARLLLQLFPTKEPHTHGHSLPSL